MFYRTFKLKNHNLLIIPVIEPGFIIVNTQDSSCHTFDKNTAFDAKHGGFFVIQSFGEEYVTVSDPQYRNHYLTFDEFAELFKLRVLIRETETSGM